MKIKIHYWYCPICGKDETYAEVKHSKDARIELEKHEAEKHKKKQVGNFGVQFKDLTFPQFLVHWVKSWR